VAELSFLLLGLTPASGGVASNVLDLHVIQFLRSFQTTDGRLLLMYKVLWGKKKIKKSN